MSKQDFMLMTRAELRKYILEDRKDEEAFQIYVDRFKSDSSEIFHEPQTIDNLNYFPELQHKH